MNQIEDRKQSIADECIHRLEKANQELSEVVDSLKDRLVPVTRHPMQAKETVCSAEPTREFPLLFNAIREQTEITEQATEILRDLIRRLEL